MGPNDRVKVINPRSKLYRKTGHVVGYPGVEVLVDLEAPDGRRRRFSFYMRELRRISDEDAKV